ncbi:MAG: hypothetical protein U0414_10960 [Polyangiaceae bacterium]
MSPSTLAWRPSISINRGERRRERSDDPRAAAGLYLDAVRRRCLVDAVVVADRAGRVLAQSAVDRAPRASTLAEEGAAVVRGESDAGLEGVDVFAHGIVVAGDPAVLVSAGSRVDRVSVVAADLKRILG